MNVDLSKGKFCPACQSGGEGCDPGEPVNKWCWICSQCLAGENAKENPAWGSIQPLWELMHHVCLFSCIRTSIMPLHVICASTIKKNIFDPNSSSCSAHGKHISQWGSL